MGRSRASASPRAPQSGRCTGVVVFCFCVGACCPSDARPLNTLPDLHQKCGRPFQVTTIGRFWVTAEARAGESSDYKANCIAPRMRGDTVVGDPLALQLVRE